MNLALVSSTSPQITGGWPFARTPYGAEPDSSKSYTAQLTFTIYLQKTMFIAFPSQPFSNRFPNLSWYCYQEAHPSHSA